MEALLGLLFLIPVAIVVAMLVDAFDRRPQAPSASHSTFERPARKTARELPRIEVRKFREIRPLHPRVHISPPKPPTAVRPQGQQTEPTVDWVTGRKIKP